MQFSIPLKNNLILNYLVFLQEMTFIFDCSVFLRLGEDYLVFLSGLRLSFDSSVFLRGMTYISDHYVFLTELSLFSIPLSKHLQTFNWVSFPYWLLNSITNWLPPSPQLLEGDLGHRTILL